MRAQLPLFGWNQIPLRWKPTQNRNVASLHRAACRHWLASLPSTRTLHVRHATTHLHTLSEEQLAAVTAPPSDSHISVIAGPGSGKTRVLTARVAELVRTHNVPPSDILVITFTNKAAEELKERLGRELGDEAAMLTAGTFHSIAVRLLRADLSLLPRAGASRRFTILDQEEVFTLLSKVHDCDPWL